MKIAISISGNHINAAFDPRFGRAPTFCLVDSESGAWSIHPNPAISASGGAGIQAAQHIVKLGAQAVISGAFGPNAAQTLEAAGIKMFIAPTDESLTAAEVMQRFKSGQLSQIYQATHRGYHERSHG